MGFSKTKYNSIYGLIRSEWYYADKEFRWSISIPANTTATAYIPSISQNNIKESGVPASETVGARFLRMENGSAVFEIGSGNYTFIVNE